MNYEPETDPGNQLTRIRSIFFMRRRRLEKAEKYTLQTQEAKVMTNIGSRQYGAGIHVLYMAHGTLIMQGLN